MGDSAPTPDCTSLLKPVRLDLDPNSPTAAREWRHWKKTFTNFLDGRGASDADKFKCLVNCVSPAVFELIEESNSFDSAIQTLSDLYDKSPNVIFARHLLATRRQQSSESLDAFLQDLRRIAKTCGFKAVTAAEYKEELIRDSFINGLTSPLIRQRLLENHSLTLQEAFDKASAMDLAQRNSELYCSDTSFHNSGNLSAMDLSSHVSSKKMECDDSAHTASLTAAMSRRADKPPLRSKTKFCYFCGNSLHPRASCPARDVNCRKCGKQGHFSKVCMSRNATSAAVYDVCASVQPSFRNGLQKAITKAKIGGRDANALIDSGSTGSFISKSIAESLKFEIVPSHQEISMADTSFKTNVLGSCLADVSLNGHDYRNVRLGVLENLCCDMIVGQDLQSLHKSVIITYGGSKPPLSIPPIDSISVLSAASVDTPELFANLSPACQPICTKSRRFSLDDRQFIAREINRLLQDGVIEESSSPWRAQVLVVKDPTERHRRRLCVDYSQTINLFTQLDAYPLPRIDDMVNSLASYSVFSTFDLKSAYHQIPIKESDKKFTAFEANGNLFQWTRVPFGVKNGVSVFQRAMDKLVKEEKLVDTFPYLDNITVAGRSKEEHDRNVERFLTVIKDRNFTLNEEKSILSCSEINILGYTVGNGVIKPDADRLRPLQDLPTPMSLKSLKRALGMLAYYAKWIPRFSDKIRPLTQVESFPMDASAVSAFSKLKDELLNVSLQSIDENVPFVVECDASDIAVAATLNQNGRPVAFLSRTLSPSEMHYPAIEKEATAIIEAVRKWSHLLSRKPFTLITDQRSVAFMLDSRKRTKVKNNKIQEWRLELASFDYYIRYRPGGQNFAADTLTRAFCANITDLSRTNLTSIHNGLCHPGVTRLLHFVRSKNLPFSTEDVKRECSSCRICAEIKPNFYRPSPSTLIKSTQPMERWSIDFKGPVPSATQNSYMLTVIDEYSRFPFAIPCPNMNASTVIRCLGQLFSLCGVPSFVHSDRGSSFVSREVKEYLTKLGVATSRSTPYHPTGNSQVERYNGIIWKAVRLALRTRGLHDKDWELVLSDALHSIRSLLSTATNMTPHERFFGFERRSAYGASLPSWMSPGPVLVKRFVRPNSSSPLVERVELLDVNPTYANIRYPNGRETSVSLRDLAPYPSSSCEPSPLEEVGDATTLPDLTTGDQQDDSRKEEPTSVQDCVVRRSERSTKGIPPDRLQLSL